MILNVGGKMQPRLSNWPNQAADLRFSLKMVEPLLLKSINFSIELTPANAAEKSRKSWE